VALAAVLALTGCVGGSGHDSSEKLAASFQALYDQALARDDLSDWDRAALEKASETGRISHADYVEGADLFDECMQAAGYDFTRRTLLNGVVKFQPPQGEVTDAEAAAEAAAQAQCYATTYGVTQELFRLQQAHPGLLADFDLAAVYCLSEAGVVGEDFTKDDFSAIFGSNTEPQDTPFDVTSDAAQTCLYSLGYLVITE
jgi:hypothetical protein